MPRGGARLGAGKKKGSFDRTTLESELAEARQMLAQFQDRQSKGHKLAIDVLNDVMHVCYGLMAKHQPQAQGEVLEKGRDPNDAKFVEFMRLTMEAGRELAPFQSSKFKSVTHSFEQRPGAQLPENTPDRPMRLSPQEAFRLMRDSDVIEMPKLLPPPKPLKVVGGKG